MSIPLDQEIRILRSLFWSDRDPDGRAFVPLVDAYRRAGDFRQAIELLSQGLERHPDFASAHAVAARLYLEKGLVEEAEIAARKVLKLDKDNVMGLEFLAGALEQRGVSDEAAECRRRLAELMAMDPTAAEEAEEVLDIAALAPDAGEAEDTEGVLDIAALAPDVGEAEDTEEVLDIAALAPDAGEAEDTEEVLDIAALAPDAGEAEENEEVLDIAALAPDAGEAEETEEDLDIAALAPDAEEAEETEEALDIAALAPDAEEAEETEEALDIAALAPDAEEAEEEEVALDIATLAPDAEDTEEEEVALAIAALAPAVEEEEEVPVVAALAPDAVEADAELPSDEVSDEPPLVTRTMAELYAGQGLTERALEIFRQLLESTPGDPGLRRRIAELETAGMDEAGPSDPADALEPVGYDDDVSGHAWDAEAQRELHEVDTPFAWTEEDADDLPLAGPAIGRYFERLLAWRPEDGRSEPGPPA